ncbi:MAG: hypothetical protein Q6A85_04310 [Enterococcus mundtii]|nr:hypothetical protein [Enterococcus mundtii]
MVTSKWKIEREKRLAHHHDVTGSISYAILINIYEVLEEINVLLIRIDSPFM